MIIFTGTVLFLEEDHFVSEDFLYVLNLMNQQALSMPENKVIQTITITITMLYPQVDIQGGFFTLGHPLQVQSTKS